MARASHVCTVCGKNMPQNNARSTNHDRICIQYVPLLCLTTTGELPLRYSGHDRNDPKAKTVPQCIRYWKLILFPLSTTIDHCWVVAKVTRNSICICRHIIQHLLVILKADLTDSRLWDSARRCSKLMRDCRSSWRSSTELIAT